MSNNFKGRKFTGYKSYPTYLERVSNYMTHIKHKSSAQDEYKSDVYEDAEVEQIHHDETNYNYPQQYHQSQSQTTYRPPSRPSSAQQHSRPQMNNQYQNPSNNGGTKYRPQMLNPAFQNARPQENYNKLFKPKDPVSSKMHQSQYENEEEVQEVVAPPTPQVPRKITSTDLRNKRQNILNNTYQGYGTSAKRSGPSYSVKLALSSGAYASDSQ